MKKSTTVSKACQPKSVKFWYPSRCNIPMSNLNVLWRYQDTELAIT